MADTSIVYLDSHLVRLWWCYFDIFDGQVLARIPGNGSLIQESKDCPRWTRGFRVPHLASNGLIYGSLCQYKSGRGGLDITYLSNGTGRHFELLTVIILNG